MTVTCVKIFYILSRHLIQRCACTLVVLSNVSDCAASLSHLSHIIGTLVRVTAKIISCGDWRLHLVLRTQISQWRDGPRSSIFLWARVLFLLVFRPVVVAPCFSFHVCSPSRCWLYVLCCTTVRGIFAWFFACDARLFTLVPSSQRASMLTYDILPNRGLHLWCLPISIASRCGIQNHSHKCCNNARVAPRSKESLQLCRLHNMPLNANMIQHSVPSTATASVFGSIQHRVHISRRSTCECCRSDGGGGQITSWGSSSWDTSARIFDTFCSVHKPSSSRILWMPPS